MAMKSAEAKRAYQRFLRSPAWIVQRSRILVRANGMCERCKKYRAKQVHHLKYAADYAQVPDTNLLAVSGKCHRDLNVPPPTYKQTIEIKLF